MGCKPISLKSRRICVGDLNNRITLQLRTMTGNNYASVENTETFSNIAEVWGAVETTRGSQLWDGAEISNPFTHNVYIRYRDDVDFTKWLDFGSQKYDIVDVENLEQSNEWLLLRCILKGTNTKAGTYA